MEPVEERSKPQAAKSSALELQALKRTQTNLVDFSTTSVIGPRGGVIAGGGAQLVIPAGALTEDVAITMTVPAGDFLDVQFAPHGLQFRVPATLSIAVRGTVAAGNRDLLSELIGVYHNDDAQDGRLTPEETFPLRVQREWAVFPIEHFSSFSLGFRGFILVGA